MSALSHAEIRRYSRHLLLPELGLEGQQRLKAASVLVVGTGGLGSPAAMYLAAAGVGRLGVVDCDAVDESNMHRQIIHGQSDIGKKKVESAAARLAEVNPFVHVEPHDVLVSRDNALELFSSYDVIADGTDNFPTRYLVNDACVLLKKPNVYASIFQFEGQVSVFDARHGPCYRCLYGEPPPPGLVPSCADGGVLGILPGVMGTLQAVEVIKTIVGIGQTLVGRLLAFDALQLRFRELRIAKDPRCAICGAEPTIRELIDYEQFCGVPAHDRRSHWVASVADITPKDLQALIQRESICLLDVREEHEWQICRLESARLIPLSELPKRMHELDSAAQIVIYCREGSRSRSALELLRSAGFGNLWNLRGGINAWSQDVDADIPIY